MNRSVPQVKAFLRSKDKFHRKIGYAISRFPSGVLLAMGEEEERKEEDFSFEVAGLSTVTSRDDRQLQLSNRRLGTR